MSLGQRVMIVVNQFLLNNVLLLICILVLAALVYEFYVRFLRVERNTDKVDLMKRYVHVQLRRRYRG